MIMRLFLACVLAGFGLSAQTEWQLTAKNIDPNTYYGITVANGMTGMISSPNPLEMKDVVLNGAYDTYSRGRVSNILKVVNHLQVQLEFDKRRANTVEFKDLVQTLDMQQAVFTSTFTSGKDAKVVYRMSALRHLPYNALVELEITALRDLELTVLNEHVTPNHLREAHPRFSHIDRPHVLIPLMTTVVQSPSGRQTVAASSTFLFEEAHGQEPSILHEQWDYDRHLAKFSVKLKKGQTYRVAIAGAQLTSDDAADPENEAERLTLYAKLEGVKRLKARHASEWAKLWASDIVIEGDVQAQRDVRSAIYHLYSFTRAGSSLSLSPMGLSGLGYNGHVFWDTELWMYPALLLLQPDMAASILDYRFDRLEAAKRRAFKYGYKGAMFPWESSESGEEDTPVWALTGPFQQHISGCVSFAFWNYYLLTQDRSWLEKKGWPVIEAVADFWLSRVEPDDQGVCHIRNVVGADEWAENIDDNAFTNAMGRQSLETAWRVAEILALPDNPAWKDIHARIPILKFEQGVTQEYAGYDGRAIKQADANLLAFPLNEVRDPEAIKKDLEYYLPRMGGDGPAMSHAVLSILYARLGDQSHATELFYRSYLPNKLPPFGVLAETAGGTNPYFATGAGGLLQAVLYGFGGLELDAENGLETVPSVLPYGWKSLTLKGIGTEKKSYMLRAQ